MSKLGTNCVTLEVLANGVALATLDHFPLNTLSNAVQLGIEDACNAIQANSKVKAVVVKGAGSRAFCAGADISDLNRKHDRLPKKRFTEYFEALSVPVIAALQGFTLGGGLELALSCHYRIIERNGEVGLPEVNIGLLPGGEGTQRLPRVMGAKAALDLMLTGKHMDAVHASKAGVVDLVVDKDSLVDEAIKFALRMAAENPTLEGRRLSLAPPPKANVDFAYLRGQMAMKRKNQPAPQCIIDCVEAACIHPSFAAGLAVEAKLFRKLLMSKEAKALQHVFFSERAAAKIPGLKAAPKPIKSVATIGSGLMAGGIAMCFADAGIHVRMLDRAQEHLDKGMAVIKANYSRSIKRGSKTQSFVNLCLSRISTTTSYDDIKDVDLVIEAVFEDMELKKDIFRKLDQVCKPGCILASNTSFLSIDEMARCTRRPGDVIGIHFFSPANVMPLLENIRGEATSPETISTAMATGVKIKKWPVLARNCHGFIANRAMSCYGAESRRLLMSGGSIEAIDNVATGVLGMPMGPFSMADLTGLAIGVEVRKRNGLFNPNTNMVDWLIEQGRLGMKSNAGYYDYDNNRKRKPSAIVAERVAITRKNCGITPKDLDSQMILEHLFYPVVNECFKLLEDGIAIRPSDIDVALVHGYNWPRVTGGPLHWADCIGLPNIVRALQKFRIENPECVYFRPSQLMVDCVNANMKLSQYWSVNGSKYISKTAASKL